MAHLESIIIPAHHTIWNGYNKRELRIEFALPEKGTNEETGFFIFAPGFVDILTLMFIKNAESIFRFI